MTPKEIEEGLTDENWRVRFAFARRTDYVPTLEQIERGLTDADAVVRWVFARRTDFVPTPAQLERGLMDKYADVREVFERRQAEWQAAELKKRHASVIPSKPTLEAL